MNKLYKVRSNEETKFFISFDFVVIFNQTAFPKLC